MTGSFRKLSILVLILLFISSLSFANEDPTKQKDAFNPGEMIMHHVQDSHEWEFAHGIVIPLPVILYSPDKTSNKLEIFSSSKFHNKDHEYNGFKLDRE